MAAWTYAYSLEDSGDTLASFEFSQTRPKSSSRGRDSPALLFFILEIMMTYIPRVLNQKRDKVTLHTAVYIGRGSKWGNPFIIGKDGTRDEVCDKFEQGMSEQLKQAARLELRGKDLVCFCKPFRCHGDFLLKLANGD